MKNENSTEFSAYIRSPEGQAYLKRLTSDAVKIHADRMILSKEIAFRSTSTEIQGRFPVSRPDFWLIPDGHGGFSGFVGPKPERTQEIVKQELARRHMIRNFAIQASV